MRLSDLDSKNIRINMVLLQTPSVHLEMFIQDKLKRRYHVNREAIIDFEVKTDYKKIKNVIGVTPPDSESWFVHIDLDKFCKRGVPDKDLKYAIEQSSTVLFFCTCSSYKIYRGFKDTFKGYSGFCDFYMNYLRRPDFIYLYDAFTLSDNKLSKPLFDYVVQSYSGDIEAVFELLIQLNQGTKIESRKDIAEFCGLGGLSIESYIFSLLKPLSGSDKGLNTVLKNRIKAGADLAETLGFRTMYNYMSSSLLHFCQLKTLIISGVVYKTVRKLPSTYNEKALAKYQKYIWKLKQIPLSDLLRLRQCIGNKVWENELDLLNFLYKYYAVQSKLTYIKMVEANKSLD